MRLLILACLFITLQTNAQMSRGASDMAGKSTEISDVDTARETLGVDLMGGNSKGITVYPNPANDHIIVSLAGKPGDRREIRLVTSMGQPVLQIPNLRENSYMLDVSRLNKGIYIVEVMSKGNVSRTKWIKQ